MTANEPEGPVRAPAAGRPNRLNAEILLDLANHALGGTNAEKLLDRVLDSARQMTDARYAAVGVIEKQTGGPAEPVARLAQFVVAGIDPQTTSAIGALPAGRGVLGTLIADPRPLRLADIGAHPHSYGFPDAHPPMSTFLGVPIFVDGQAYANIYLTEKSGGAQFSDQDQSAVVMLAEIAGLAIGNARRERAGRGERDELGRRAAALEVTSQITRAIGGRTDLETILELVAKRGRAVVDARLLLIEVEDGSELVVVAGVGEMPHGILGARLALRGTVAEQALLSRATQRLGNERNRIRFQEHGLGGLGVEAHDGLIIPLVCLDRTYGALVALDRRHDGPRFSDEDVRLLEAFAASAATALATGTAVALDLQRLAAVIEASSDAIVTVDREGLITTWNPGAEALYGLSGEEMLGRRGIDAMPGLTEPELGHDVLGRVLAGETILPYEITHEHADGSKLELSLSASPIRDIHGRVMGAASITRDVGEQNQMKRVLAQSQRLDSIGALAGGVAHDMSNVLGVIINHADFALEGIEDDATADEIREIRRAADGAAALMGQLLQFARQDSCVPSPGMALGASVTDMVKMLARTIGEQIELRVDLGSPLWIAADRTQVEQVLVNLALNARDAMPDGGVLTISTYRVPGKLDIPDAGAPSAEDFICLSVTDTGEGMSAEAVSKAFEPFFTTKPAGPGTGLGLATVFGIVTRAGGRAEIDSEPGKGTAVRLYWRSALPTPGVNDPRPVPSGEPIRPAHREVILLVEDDDSLRNVTARLLRAEGYSVLAAALPSEAIEIAGRPDQHIDLLFTDLVMPGMPGASLAASLHEARPELTVLFTSGYGAGSRVGSAFLRKPFTRASLLGAVAAALETQRLTTAMGS